MFDSSGLPQIEADLDTWAREASEIMARGVEQAQAESRAKGVPLVYSINGILHWEMPDGSLTTEDPWKTDSEAADA